MNNVALVTAKGGNQSLPNKNLINIGGIPSLAHSIIAAEKSNCFDSIWVTSEDSRILDVAREFGVSTITRPDTLAQPLTNHGDVIMHARSHLIENGIDFETLTILLGNTVMTRPSDIQRAIQALDEDESATGAMTVWVAQDDHPYRAMTQGSDGYLRSFLDLDAMVDTNRQSYPEVLFYDQGPWTTRYETLTKAERSDGPGPWWWMGNRVIPLRRDWVTGRDTHTQFDLDISEWWLSGDHSQPLT
jgi:CMP-N-acetylneuraminic acid synthetase